MMVVLYWSTSASSFFAGPSFHVHETAVLIFCRLLGPVCWESQMERLPSWSSRLVRVCWHPLTAASTPCWFDTSSANPQSMLDRNSRFSRADFRDETSTKIVLKSRGASFAVSMMALIRLTTLAERSRTAMILEARPTTSAIVSHNNHVKIQVSDDKERNLWLAFGLWRLQQGSWLSYLICGGGANAKRRG